MDESLIAAAVAAALVLGGAVALLAGRRKPEGEPATTPEPAAGETPGGREEPADDAGTAGIAAAPSTSDTAAATPDGPDTAAAETVPTDDAAPPTAADDADERTAPERTPEDEVRALRKGLASTRGGFIARLARLFRSPEPLDAAQLEELEEVLLGADLGVHTADRLLGRLRERLAEGAAEDDAWAALRQEARAILDTGAGRMRLDGDPAVVLIVGVNGVGKTTTIGKLAAKLAADGKRVLLAAGDTFRAAAIPQLESWGRRVGVPVVAREEGADPAALIFDAVRRARDEGMDVVLADTAGRLHTKSNLMDELAKVGRSASKALGRPVDETLLVLDATTGQNAVQQAKLFKDALPITGLVLTKLDGTAKGGVVLGIVDQHGIPVRYVGIGEKVDDLREFDAESFVRALFDNTEDPSLAA